MKVFVFGNGTLRVGRVIEGLVSLEAGAVAREVGSFPAVESKTLGPDAVVLEFQDKKSALVLVEEIHLAIRNLPWEKGEDLLDQESYETGRRDGLEEGLSRGKTWPGNGEMGG